MSIVRLPASAEIIMELILTTFPWTTTQPDTKTKRWLWIIGMQTQGTLWADWVWRLYASHSAVTSTHTIVTIKQCFQLFCSASISTPQAVSPDRSLTRPVKWWNCPLVICRWAFPVVFRRFLEQFWWESVYYSCDFYNKSFINHTEYNQIIRDSNWIWTASDISSP